MLNLRLEMSGLVPRVATADERTAVRSLIGFEPEIAIWVNRLHKKKVSSLLYGRDCWVNYAYSCKILLNKDKIAIFLFELHPPSRKPSQAVPIDFPTQQPLTQLHCLVGCLS